MASNLRVDSIVPATGSNVSIGTATGGVNIPGVLTYEDVTNVDSIGIITARSTISIADSIVHTGDTNTSLRFPAADTFAVETAGNERLRITSTGTLQVQGDGNAYLQLERYQNNDKGSRVRFVKSRSDTVGTNAIVQDGDTLGTIDFYGSDGNSGTRGGASISAVVDGTPGSADMPSRLIFKTVPDNSTVLTERLRITSSGEISIGGFAPTAGAGVLQIAGGLRVAGSGSASDTVSPYIYRSSGVDNLNFATSGVSRLRIGSDGVVTISNSNPPSTGAMTFITDDGSATTLGTAATLRVANNGGSASYSVFEAESGSGSLRLANDGKFYVSGNGIFSSNINVDVNTGADGIVGEAYNTYFGLKHSDQSLNSEYMIISNNSNTYISCTSGYSIYVRPSANSSAHETIFAHGETTFNTHLKISGHALRRSNHHTGHLEGSYNNVGANSTKSNPIYTIGSNYNPGDNDLGNMYGIGYSHGNNASFISFSGLTGWGLYVAADGDCRMFLDASTGKIAATGTITGSASDVRLKKNIEVIDNPIEKIKKIRGVTFDWIENITTEYDFHPDSMHETGVIAQEIQEVIPDAVATAPFNGNYTKKSGTDNNFLTVKNEKIIPLCIEAIKELSAQVELLKSKVATLEGS